MQGLQRFVTGVGGKIGRLEARSVDVHVNAGACSSPGRVGPAV